MRDIKVLKELMENIVDSETRQKMSCKPFKPCYLDAIISKLAPKFYSKEEMAQVMEFHKLHPRIKSRSRTMNSKRTITKRHRQVEEMLEDERVTKKPKVIITSKNKASPDLPAKFKSRITQLNGHDIKFIMHKRLFLSDLRTNNNRLSMPLKEIMSDFLTEDEKSKLDEKEGTSGRCHGVEVIVLDPCLREFTLLLKKWKMQTTSIYNLVKDWNKIVSANEFVKDHKLQMWSFRDMRKVRSYYASVPILNPPRKAFPESSERLAKAQ
ncbi:B3 domain-containing protein At2g24670-like [Abrus precatorius]|uniref:B3 domain-containing protein At2g24670-like n=1 Tax=Abrus precatorius TaxID=3816 RepID=A0A8B8M3W6_ABRPR|nr:B3 domain-containing protein At2g24670-like [Abrus precatorius]